MKRFFLARMLALSLLLAPVLAHAAPNPPDVVGDGVADDTAAIQSALDKAGQGGGVVALEPRRYLLKGSLTVPTGVTLRGSWEAPHHGAWDKGTTLLCTNGRGQEEGPAAITLQQSAALRGVTMAWPEEKPDNIVPYPWAVHGVGMHNTVENVTLINAYQGIKIGQPSSELHLLRNIFGCVLRRGIFIDATTDVGRVENVHFNTHYWIRSKYPPIQLADDGATGKAVTDFAVKNLEAFIFGRTDWEYVANTFVWGARIGYHFIKTPEGACNGQFLGIGADYCQVGLLGDYFQGIGIQVTNAEFTAFAGGANAGVVIAPTASGGAQFVNCNFWTTPGGAALVHGPAQVTFSACRFAEGAPGGVIVADGGHVIVNSCSFAAGGKAVVLKPGVRSAIVTSNSQPGGLVITNGIGSAARIGLNEVAYTFPAAVTGHYRVRIGTTGDEEFLGEGWQGGENTEARAAGFESQFSSARWTNGNGVLRLPVRPGVAYTLTATVLTRPNTPPATLLASGAKATLAVGKEQRVTLSIPATATKGKNFIDVRVTGEPWTPAALIPGSGDTRKLGVRVFDIEMKAMNGPAQAKRVN